MKTTRHWLYSVMLATLCCANARAADLDLSDCDVLIGKKQNAAYKGWMRDNQKSAEAGGREAIRLRAIEASNRLACHQEAITGDDGWSMTVTSGDGTSETQLPPGIPNIRKHPGAWQALNQAAKYGHEAGAFDVGHKGAATELVVRYAADLPQYLEGAYEDAAAVYEHDCVLKRKFGERDRDFGCVSARTARARLIPLVAAERRRALDASARRWAEQLPSASK